MFLQFRSGDITPRTPDTYDYHCTLVSGLLHEADSTTYGINYRNKLDNFHVVAQLPQDIMHILLEGIIPYELSIMLYNFITEEKYFTAQLLNDRIASFLYSTQEAKDKPIRKPIRMMIYHFSVESKTS